jgi:hypothetical protein
MSDFEPTPPGDAVDPDEIPETDLSDFESQVVEQFNAREAQSSTASDEVSADASPSPGSEAAAPAQSGAALDFVEPVDDQVGSESSPDPDQNLWAGYDETNQQMARGVYDWYTKLDESAVATVDAALSGDYVLVPTDQIQTLQENWDRLTAPQPDPAEYQQQAYQQQYDEEDIDYEDPVVQEMLALRERLDMFEGQQVNEQIQQTIENEAIVIDEVFNYWASQHPYLNGDELGKVQNWVVQSGVFDTYASDYGVEQATLMALDQALFNDADLRMKAVQPLVDDRVQQEMLAAQEQAQRGMRASAVSGSSNTEPDSMNLSPEEAMVEEIRRSLEGL